jgi:integrase
VLTDAKIKAAKKKAADYKLSDSGQLYLHVSKAGGKSWRMNYTFGLNARGKPAQKTLTFGPYPALTLVDARERRDEAKAMLRDGRDPAVERRLAVKAQTLAHLNSFESVMETWFELNSGWSVEKLRAWMKDRGGTFAPAHAEHWTIDPNGRWSPQHASDVITSLWRDVCPAIGDLPISIIRAPKVLEVLQAVERRGAIETAHRLRQRISGVFTYGIAAGVCEENPAAGIGKALKDIPKAKPQPSIIDGCETQEQRITRFRQMLIDCLAERCRAVNKFALMLLALTHVRPGELAGARWAEFSLDIDQPVWRIPAARMKGDKERKSESGGDHVVTLSRQAVQVLCVLRKLTGRYALCFPSERHVHRPISENTLRELLIRAGYYQRHVPHGFRAAFSTIMNERPAAERKEGDRDVIDLMLAHLPEQKSGSESAYNRSAHMPRRHELAQIWADLILGGFWEPEIHIGQPIRYAATGPGRLAA